MYQADFKENFENWLIEAKVFLQGNISPEEISWTQENLSIFGVKSCEVQKVKTFNLGFYDTEVFKKFKKETQFASMIKDPKKWSLFYRVLFRIAFENTKLLSINSDPDIRTLYMYRKAIARDIHKMHAFVRFKSAIGDDGVERFMAWHKPEHYILEATASFFVRRFGDKPWVICTPYLSVSWDLKELIFFKGMEQRDFNVKDSWDSIWKSYYKSIYNPSRINSKAMMSEMPQKYWSTLPEADLIQELLRK